MQMTATTTAAPVAVPGSATPLIQNLGPDPVFLGPQGVTTGNGLKLAVDAAYEFPGDLGRGPGKLYAVSTGSSDLRILIVG